MSPSGVAQFIAAVFNHASTQQTPNIGVRLIPGIIILREDLPTGGKSFINIA